MSNVTQLKIEPKSDDITYAVKQLRIDQIRAFNFQPRKWFDEAEIRARAQSIKTVGQQAPVTVEPLAGDPDHDYELIDGESRLRSAKEAGLKTLWAAVRSVPFGSKVEKHLAALVANFNRSEHTPMEISDALVVQTTQGGLTRDQVAKALGRTESWVCFYLSLQKLIPEIQALMHPALPRKKRLAAHVAFEIARMTTEDQKQLLRYSSDRNGEMVLLRRKVRDMVKNRQDASEERQSRDSMPGPKYETNWTLEREARRQAMHTPNPTHVARLRAGIAEFRALLNR